MSAGWTSTKRGNLMRATRRMDLLLSRWVAKRNREIIILNFAITGYCIDTSHAEDLLAAFMLLSSLVLRPPRLLVCSGARRT